jgi:hypothetical protein
MKIETEVEISHEQRATTPALFQICLRYFSVPVATVASDLLFWSQCGHNKLRGREGFYKEDAELVEAIGKDRSSIRRALSPICAKVGEDRPDALFEMDHGPKPGQRSGRVRWLFRKPRGDELIKEALLLAQAREEKRQRSATKRGRKPQSIRPNWMGRSAQNERTLYQKDLSEGRSEILSSAKAEREKTDSYEKRKKFREEIKSEKETESREEIKRLVRLWNTVCEEGNRPMLAWHPSEVGRWSTKLSEFVQELGLADMSDEDLLNRLRLLVGDLEWLRERMGDAFMQYNTDGLLIESFVRYGKRLWLATAKRLAEERQRLNFRPKKSLKDFAV